MDVYFRFVTSKDNPIKLHFENDATVSDAKAAISNNQNVPLDGMRLLFKSKILSDTTQLSEFATSESLPIIYYAKKANLTANQAAPPPASPAAAVPNPEGSASLSPSPSPSQPPAAATTATTTTTTQPTQQQSSTFGPPPVAPTQQQTFPATQQPATPTYGQQGVQKPQHDADHPVVFDEENEPHYKSISKEEAIRELTEISGLDEEKCTEALRLTLGNMNIATELLLSGDVSLAGLQKIIQQTGIARGLTEQDQMMILEKISQDPLLIQEIRAGHPIALRTDTGQAINIRISPQILEAYMQAKYQQGGGYQQYGGFGGGFPGAGGYAGAPGFGPSATPGFGASSLGGAYGGQASQGALGGGQAAGSGFARPGQGYIPQPGPTPGLGAQPGYSYGGYGGAAPGIYGAAPGGYGGATPGGYGGAAPGGYGGATPGGYGGAAPGGYGGAAPGGYGGATPGIYGATPGIYGATPGIYGATPGGYGATPGGYGATPGGYGAQAAYPGIPTYNPNFTPSGNAQIHQLLQRYSQEDQDKLKTLLAEGFNPNDIFQCFDACENDLDNTRALLNTMND